MPPGTNENNRRFYALAYSETVSQLPSKFVLSAGSEWAKVAQRLILGHGHERKFNGECHHVHASHILIADVRVGICSAS